MIAPSQDYHNPQPNAPGCSENPTEAGDAYPHVEYALGGTNRRNNIIAVDHYAPNGHSDCFRSMLRFPEAFRYHFKNTYNEKGENTVAGYKGAAKADFVPLDLDSEGDPARAHEDACSIVRSLETRYDVPPNALRIYYSGNKGFSIEIDETLFGGLPPGKDVPAKLKAMALEIAGETESLDSGIYYTVCLWRTPNTKHGETGLYKIPLTVEELFSLSIEEIRELAKAPRHDFEPIHAPEEYGVCPALAELWIRVEANIQRSDHEYHEPLDLVAILNGIPKGKRDIMIFKYACSARGRGVHKHEAKVLVAHAARNCDPPFSEKVALEKVDSAYRKYPPNDDEAEIYVSKKDKPIDAIDTIDTVSMDLPDAKPFPVEALPKAAQQLVKEAAASIGCPPEFVGVPMLVTLASAVGNARVLKLKEGWTESATIYGAIVAEPGEKKSPAQAVATEPAIKQQAALREEYRKKVDEYKRELREYEVDKKAAARDGEAAPPPPEAPTMERTVVEDTTIEALAVVLGDNPRGVMSTRDELAAWVRSMDQYRASGRGADRQFWLSAWSNRYVSVDRKSRGEPLILPRPFVGVFGAIQPAVLPELGQGREDGLLDRFLFAYPQPVPSRWTDDEISAEARAAYRELYNGLRELHMHLDNYGDPAPKSVVLTADAKSVFVDLINNHREEMERPGFPARLKGPWSKLEAYLARLALVLALARSVEDGSGEIVRVADVVAASLLLEYFKNHARRVYVGLYGENQDDRLAADVATFLEARGGAWEGQPAELHAQIKSRYKPARPDELSKKLKAIAERMPGLHVESFPKWVKELGNNRRFLRMFLKNGVNGVNGVNDDGASEYELCEP